MKKKMKVICIAIIGLVILGIVFGIVDVNRAKNDLKPIFSINIGIYMDGGTAEYYGLGYKIIIYNKINNVYEGRYQAVKVGTWFMSYEDGLKSQGNVVIVGDKDEVRFIRTYEVVADLKMPDETGNFHYYTIKQYQNEEPVVIKIENKYKLEENQNYEFTFTGTVPSKSFQYFSISEIFEKFTIVDIVKTEKEGSDQVQQDVYNENLQMTNPYKNTI